MSGYRNMDEYIPPEELAEINIKKEKKEKLKRVLMNNLKMKTLYDPFNFFEELAESQADNKFSRKTKQQKAEILANDQFDMNINLNFVEIQKKINEMIKVINICCEKSNIEEIFLNTDDKNELFTKFLALFYAMEEQNKQSKREIKQQNKEAKTQRRMTRSHADNTSLQGLMVDVPRRSTLPGSLNNTFKMLLSQEENKDLFLRLLDIGKKIKEKNTLSEEDENFIEDFQELYKYFKNRSEFKIMIELIFGFILNYDDNGSGPTIKYRDTYEPYNFCGASRYKKILQDQISKGYLVEVFKQMGLTEGNLKDIFTDKLLSNPTPDNKLKFLKGFEVGSKKNKKLNKSKNKKLKKSKKSKKSKNKKSKNKNKKKKTKMK